MRSILTVFLGFYSFVQGNIHLSGGNCGSTFGKCASGYCCSRYGYCGTSLAYCGDGCQPRYGTCLSVPTFAPTISTNADGHCGLGFGSCSQGYCCSSSGYCGTSSAYCGTGCQAKYGSCSSVPSFRPTTSAQPVAPDGRCGAGIGSCLSSYCCSSYGYCGKTSAYCGSGCQLQYGVCTATASPIISPSVFPSSLPTASPIFSITPTTIAASSLPTTSNNILSSIASWTYYNAYPKCCPNEPNYDPNYPTTECVQYNGCAHPGDFAAIGQRSLSYTESNDLISFYDNSDPNGNNFYSKYGNKYISIIGECNGVSASFTALIADTCGNNDCGGCCALNANPITGYLIDMEYYTVIRHFGTTDCADAHHNLQFSIDLNQPPAIPNCGPSYGPCHGPQECCSSSDYCGFSSEYCGAGCQSAYGYCADVVGGCGPASGQVCSSGLCCSEYGYCGSGSAYCGSGCQVGYGNCQ